MTLAVFVAVGGCLLTLLLVAWVLAALRGDGRVPSVESGGLLALLTEREAVLAGLRDLDADLASGRLNPAGHAQLREEALRNGSRLIAEIDLRLEQALGEKAGALAALEEAVAIARGRDGESGPRDVTGPAPRRCPSCDRVTASADRFCRHCGRDLSPTRLA